MAMHATFIFFPSPCVTNGGDSCFLSPLKTNCSFYLYSSSSTNTLGPFILPRCAEPPPTATTLAHLPPPSRAQQLLLLYCSSCCCCSSLTLTSHALPSPQTTPPPLFFALSFSIFLDRSHCTSPSRPLLLSRRHAAPEKKAKTSPPHFLPFLSSLGKMKWISLFLMSLYQALLLIALLFEGKYVATSDRDVELEAEASIVHHLSRFYFS